MMKGMGRTPTATKPTAPKPSPTKAPTTSPSPTKAPTSSSNTIKSSRLNKALSGVKRFGEEVEVDSFDIILEYLVGSGFPEQEALIIMAEMSEEKREQILENRRAARNPESQGSDKKYEKVRGERTPMPPRGDKRREDFEKWYATQMRKEEFVSEEDYDKMKDERMMRGGVDGNNRYDRAPKSTKSDAPKGKTMAQLEMEKRYGKGATAMDIVRKQMEDKYGKGAIMDPKKKKE